MRRGTMATWQSPGGPREAQVALTRGRRPCGRAHADAREGRHVAGKGLAVGGHVALREASDLITKRRIHRSRGPEST